MNGTHVGRRSRSARMRALGWLAVASSLAMALFAPASTALAVPGNSVTICHSTGSLSNPYVVNSPNYSGEGGLTGDHTIHTGPVFDFANPASTPEWGDIIPPFAWDGGSFPGMNWTVEGQAVWNAGCNNPAATQPPATQPPATQPPATQPPATDPPATDPPATDPPATDPPATQPPATDPPTCEEQENCATEPPATEPPGEGGVEGETGTPRVTLPPTSSIDGGSTPNTDSWRLMLVGFAAIMAGILVLAPSGRGRRARR